MKPTVCAAAMVTGIVALAACSTSREAAQEAAPPVVITYTASDYAFTGPPRFPPAPSPCDC